MLVRAIIGAIVALGIGGGAGYWVAPGSGEDPNIDALEVVFFDAGQADCAVILTPAVDGHEEGVIVIGYPHPFIKRSPPGSQRWRSRRGRRPGTRSTPSRSSI